MENVEPRWMVNMVLFLVATVATVTSVIQAMNSRRVQKREVTLMEGAATQVDVERVKLDCQARIGTVAAEVKALDTKMDAKLDAIRDKMDRDKTEIMAGGEARAGKIHDRVDIILKAVSKLDGKLEARQAEN